MKLPSMECTRRFKNSLPFIGICKSLQSKNAPTKVTFDIYDCFLKINI